MIEQRKQAISIRLGGSDLRNVKRLAKRLGVRDSDIIRYAIKSMLSRIAPLCDEGSVGKKLIPVLIESGDDLIRHFELDSYRLDSIVNGKAEHDVRIDRDDIALLAMNGLREQYLLMRIKDGHANPEAAAPGSSMREYLYEKYVYPGPDAQPSEFKLTTDGHGGAERPAA